jgi:hypothetical protein
LEIGNDGRALSDLSADVRVDYTGMYRPTREAYYDGNYGNIPSHKVRRGMNAEEECGTTDRWAEIHVDGPQ